MGKAYPEELRHRVVAAYKDGKGSYAGLGRLFLVGEATVNRWVAMDRKTGVLTPRRPGGGKVRKIPLAGELMVQKLVTDEPNWTTQELADELNEVFGIDVSRHSVGRLLKRLGQSFKRGFSDLPRSADPRTSRSAQTSRPPKEQ